MDTLAVSSAEDSGTTSVNDVETSVAGISVVQVAIPNQPVQVFVVIVWCHFSGGSRETLNPRRVMKLLVVKTMATVWVSFHDPSPTEDLDPLLLSN